MKKPEIRVFPTDPSVYYVERRKHIWVTKDVDDIVFYQDTRVTMPDKIGKIKIAWLFEPEPINQGTYHYIRQNWQEFDYIFTWDKELCAIDPRFVFVPYGTSYITNVEKYEIYEKTKNVSIIASEKDFLEGHKLRHAAIRKYRPHLDLYGRGYNPFEFMLTALKDYRFSIVIENTNKDCNFSEKLVSTLLCGTVPIFWGCPSIGEIFDIRGILTFNDLDELGNILNTLSEEKYNEMLPYVKANFETAQKYTLVDDTVFEKMVELGIVENCCDAS